ncbi:MAG: hypothetical protein WD025_08050 [Bacteriovoracaceae bacterium]
MIKALLLIGVLTCSSVFGAKEKKKELDEKTKKTLSAVFEQNEKLHDAFFNYDAKKVEEEAEKLEEEIEKIKAPEISKLLKFSKEKLDEIEDDKDRKENNQNYHLVSMALIHVMNTYDVGDKYAAFQCPMVKKKWIQNKEKQKQVMNPYAPEMPHCGAMD